jgi:uncharacterized membrane protein YphA (DoxX/SURF4 family)
LRRLFSTFADGWPGAGLLLMRVVAGSALLVHGVSIVLQGNLSLVAAGRGLFIVFAGLFLLAGLWTPIIGSLAAVLGVVSLILGHGDLWADVLLTTLGASLALLGPGAWSVDARLFGWKRIDVRDRKN